MGAKVCMGGKKTAKKFKKLDKKIRRQAKKQGLTAISNRARLFIDGRPNRRWWFSEDKTGILVSEEYGLCDEEAVAKLNRFRKVKSVSELI